MTIRKVYPGATYKTTARTLTAMQATLCQVLTHVRSIGRVPAWEPWYELSANVAALACSQAVVRSACHTGLRAPPLCMATARCIVNQAGFDSLLAGAATGFVPAQQHCRLPWSPLTGGAHAGAQQAAPSHPTPPAVHLATAVEIDAALQEEQVDEEADVAPGEGVRHVSNFEELQHALAQGSPLVEITDHIKFSSHQSALIHYVGSQNIAIWVRTSVAARVRARSPCWCTHNSAPTSPPRIRHCVSDVWGLLGISSAQLPTVTSAAA